MALGSCVAVILLDPVTKTVGMAHVALPDSALNEEKGITLPGYFADTGIDALIRKMQEATQKKSVRGFYVKITGGANVLKGDNTFDIGKRNVLAIKRILWQKYGTGPVAEDVGGKISRTVTVYVDTGSIEIFCPGKGTWNL
jgi:chemotaxis protein CheD